MQIQCIHIRGDFENTFCLYMRLLRFDVQLLFLKKKDRNFYEPSNSEQKKFFGGRGTIGVFGSYIPNFHTLSSFFAIRAFSVILNLQNRSIFSWNNVDDILMKRFARHIWQKRLFAIFKHNFEEKSNMTLTRKFACTRN